MSCLRRQETLDWIRKYESRNVTWLPEKDSEESAWPIVWERAKGMRVWDCDGGEYLDLRRRLVWRLPGMRLRPL